MTAVGTVPERDIARDVARRALPLAPVVMVACTIGWGSGGAAAGLLALAIVVVNLLAAGAALAWAAPLGGGILMGVALGSFAVRMGLVCAVVYAVRDASWLDLNALAAAVLVSQLALLFWEARYVSASLAFPGLKPPAPTGEGA